MFSPSGLAVTPRGVVIFGSDVEPSIWALEPSTGRLELVASVTDSDVKGSDPRPALSSYWEAPCAIAIANEECCAYVCDRYTHSVKRLTLPRKWFDADPPKEHTPHPSNSTPASTAAVDLKRELRARITNVTATLT